MTWTACKTPSPQPAPHGERECAAALWSREEDYSGVPSPLGEKDRMRGDSTRADRSVKIGAVLAALLVAGCDLSMTQQPKYTPETPSQFWANGTSARPIPANTVAQGDLAREAAAKNPPPVTLALLMRGQQRFEMFCSPCHGLSGYGDGMVVQRGFPHPPSFFSQRLLAADVRHFFNVQTKGFGVMYSYADRVSEADRWAIAAYIRALQVSQHATLAMAPEAAEKVK
jgi:mono/diheme cytochrome c family protein